MILENLRDRIRYDCHQMLEWCECGAGATSALPTLAWALGAATAARRLLPALFRRSLFRRVPVWELMLQHLLFVWLVVYSVQVWALLARLLKLLVGALYDQSVAALFGEEPFADERHKYLAQQCAVWVAGAAPLALLHYTRPRPQPPPFMIWMTTSPWQRRELGPHGYYLQRPPPPPRAPPHAPPPLRARRAASDTRLAPRPHSPRATHHNRCSKSV